MSDKDDLIQQATRGTGTPGSKPRDLLYPQTDHDKIIATESLVEVMRQHQVQQGIVMQSMAEEITKMSRIVDSKLDSMEKIFHEHCKEQSRDCGTCRLEIDRKISEAENRANNALAKAMGRIETLIEKQDNRFVPRWILASIGTLIITAFIYLGEKTWSHSDYISGHKVTTEYLENFVKKHHAQDMENFINGHAEPVTAPVDEEN